VEALAGSQTAAIDRPRTGWSASALLRFARSQPLGFGSAVFLGVVIFMAIFAGVVAPYGPLAVAPAERLQAPSLHHLFGTDAIGRDVLSRVIYGSRVSLVVGFAAVVIGVGIGALIGIVSAYFGSYVDITVQRVLDAVMSIPGLLLAIVIANVIGTGTINTILPIAIVLIPSNARVIRSSVLSLKERPFVEAARVVGCGRMRIMVRHILPNVVAPIIILASVVLGGAIIVEASLSFLGFGTPPPNPSWGNMLSGSGQTYLERAPWIGGFPGLTITAVVLAVNLLGDALRDVLDPRLRGSGR
jgi:ABC-type dipeptide/oligopeptide/nickel transport system permease subunit